MSSHGSHDITGDEKRAAAAEISTTAAVPIAHGAIAGKKEKVVHNVSLA
jgi:hypothetical protein